MNKTQNHITKTITSSIEIDGKPALIWENITNVKIEQFSDPWIFRLLGIPKPLSAELLAEGKGGQRIAYFDTGKKFVQEITSWEPLKEYSFNFNPEKGFIVGHFFDISNGVFRVLSGAYFLSDKRGRIELLLQTTYSLDRRIYWLFNLPVSLVMKAFQKYLLTAIKRNSE